MSKSRIDDLNQQALSLSLAAQTYYWSWLKHEASLIYRARVNLEKAREKFEALKISTGQLKLELQQKFYLWFCNTLRKMTSQDSAVFYEVLGTSSPNILSSQPSMDASGAVAVTVRALRVFLIPLQKIIQYMQWRNTPEQLRSKNPPSFTRQDAFYLALDIVLLGLTAAAFFVGAPIPAAAIALSAAVISAGVATYHYAKYLYEGYQLKKEKSEIDAVLDKYHDDESLANNPYLKTFIQEQREKAALDMPNKTFISDHEMLQARSQSLGGKIKASIENRYKQVRQTLGFTLTMMGIVSASLILGGAVLGPVGVPLIMAGVALGFVTTGIAVGMMIANWVKNSREQKQAQQAAKTDLIIGSDRTTENTIQHSKQLAALYSRNDTPKMTASTAAQPSSVTKHDVILLPDSSESVTATKSTLFNKTPADKTATVAHVPHQQDQDSKKLK